ncbi:MULTISPECIES: hypothetical protein [Streptomyces]|uniref:Uncharacterized protein n=1 Tax=Streptomyces canarius TaxID=285453 RepID=A0ABQ3D4P9_9ACTN|nr:hypothetical protein [Streptomyces canarius]GHA55335.1 hypothetical protein GCM10010345_69980 [Streptomyces canarius]
MAPDKYALNPEGLLYHGRPLKDALPEFLSAERKRLGDLLAMERPEWWDDEIGRTFTRAFHEYGNITITQLDKLMEALRTVADLTDGTVRSNQETEERNIKAAQNFGGRTGGTH